MNALWPEQRNDREKVFEVESKHMQEGIKQNGLPDKSLAYILALQTGATDACLRSLYNTTTVKRKSWEVTPSIRSILDGLSNLILISVPPGTNHADQNLPIGIGMDGFSQGTRRGLQASMDTKLLETLLRRTK